MATAIFFLVYIINNTFSYETIETQALTFLANLILASAGVTRPGQNRNFISGIHVSGIHVSGICISGENRVS